MLRAGVLSAMISLAAAVPAAAQDFEGTLQPGDSTLVSGEYADTYLVTVSAGETITVDMRSGEFDPYLILRSPAGEQWDNDDYEGDLSHSRIELKTTIGGTWEVTATSYSPGDRGAYTIDIVLSQ